MTRLTEQLNYEQELTHKFFKRTEFFKYENIWVLSNFTLDKFIRAIELGDILIDFDARTGHNHGTKFRLRNNRLPELYENVLKL